MKAKPSALVDTRVIYCGDNLDQLQKLPDKCVDLIYIDPPFNSNRNYEAFWGETKERRAFEDRHASTAAYIDFMRPRCIELHRVLKETGSFYYHCDWHASHYVKVMLDQIFGENQFQNEIVWKRSQNRSSMSRIYRRAHDVLFFYSRGGRYPFNMEFKPLSQASIDLYKHKDEKGNYQLVPLLVSGMRNGETGQAWRGIDPNKCGKSGMHWVTKPSVLEQYERDGKVWWPGKAGGQPRLKYYLTETPGVPLSDVWDDIELIASASAESRGYPTQKPLPLLERIIRISSEQNDIVLDAFCGCGTALEAAENLGRQWIGVDVSPTACQVIAKRLREKCGLKESEALRQIGRGYTLRDLPWSEDKLRKIPHFEFENWAVIRLNGIPNKAKVGDMGIDGRIFPVTSMPSATAQQTGELDFMDRWYPIQVKQKDKAGRPDIDSFEAVLTRCDRPKGFFVSFDFTSDALQEIRRFQKQTGKVIKPLKVADMLDDDALTYQLA